ncbi:MAG TPA: hypothetical protein VFO18_13300 [Methylomirabilota bacterium]|nr:hypothetical protein [Methylomirabilota bacterium]
MAGRLVPAEAFVDPGSGWPRVFRTVQGLLWVMPGGRRRPGAAG